MLFVFCLLGPLAGDRGKLLAIEAPKGPRKAKDRGISPGKGRFGSIARGPLGQDRGKMLAMAQDGPRKGGQPRPVQPRLCCSRGPWLKIEGDHAPVWRQDGPRRGFNPSQCN